MKKRNIPSINAGSMADIAFLLLVFFLVTTTIASEEGIKQDLPKLEEGTGTSALPNNVFEIKINDNNQILLEGKKEVAVNELKNYYQQFLTNPNDLTGIPSKQFINVEKCDQKASKTRGKAKKAWLYKKRLVQQFGAFEELPKAHVSIDASRKANYQTYIEVQNQLREAVVALKADFCITKLNRTYASLDKKINKDKQIRDVLDLMYPLRISDVAQ